MQSGFTVRLVGRRAFTLVELLVVIAIIGTLVGLLLPAVQAAREAGRRTTCGNNMRQIALAMHAFADAKSSLPPGSQGENTFSASCHFPSNFFYCGQHSWASFVLPYMEEQNIYDRIDFAKRSWSSIAGIDTYHSGGTVGDSANRSAADSMPKTFRCPTTPLLTAHHKDYSAASMGAWQCCPERLPTNSTNIPDGLFYRNSKTRFKDIVDGTSNTFMLIEAAHNWFEANGTPYSRGANDFLFVNHASSGLASGGYALNAMVSSDRHRFARSHHQGGVNTALADVSVRFVDDSVSLTIYRATYSRAGQELTVINK